MCRSADDGPMTAVSPSSVRRAVSLRTVTAPPPRAQARPRGHRCGGSRIDLAHWPIARWRLGRAGVVVGLVLPDLGPVDLGERSGPCLVLVLADLDVRQ